MAAKLLEKEMRVLQREKEKEGEQRLKRAKSELQREFVRKRELVLQKITALKNSNKSIEDIYKYTNDIIFEEEDEQTDNRDSDEDSVDD